ncbi:hypothetical protein [Devosia sp. FKR38]|uniref:hypothetical protein n=1 Tax=Devosia sp. FKR38 TaxID=2562312 RepID=UPI0010C055AC|nr:hypothetical protein [Devosia sp. FKR38]
MTVLFIRGDVAVDVQLQMAAAAGLSSVSIALATVEALGTMRFRSLLERHDTKVSAIYGDLRDEGDDRLRDIARVLAAEPVVGSRSGWERLELGATPDLLTALKTTPSGRLSNARRLELAPTRMAWSAIVEVHSK